MDKNTIVRKLTSRKLWVAIVGIIVGIAAAFGVEGNEYANIAGVVTAAASVVAYVFGEAKVDAGHVALPPSTTGDSDKSE